MVLIPFLFRFPNGSNLILVIVPIALPVLIQFSFTELLQNRSDVQADSDRNRVNSGPMLDSGTPELVRFLKKLDFYLVAIITYIPFPEWLWSDLGNCSNYIAGIVPI